MAGQIISRGPDKWMVRIFLGRNADGKRLYQNHMIHGKKKDAQKWPSMADFRFGCQSNTRPA